MNIHFEGKDDLEGRPQSLEIMEFLACLSWEGPKI